MSRVSRLSKPAEPAKAAVAKAAQPAAVAAGRADGDHDDGDEADAAAGRFVHGRTSVAESGIHKPEGAVKSIFEAGARAGSDAKKARKVVELLDLAKIRIEHDVPLPDLKERAQTRAYNQLLAAMQVGDSVLLTVNQARTLRAAGNKRGLGMSVRELGDGNARVWRLDKQPRAQRRAA